MSSAASLRWLSALARISLLVFLLALLFAVCHPVVPVALVRPSEADWMALVPEARSCRKSLVPFPHVRLLGEEPEQSLLAVGACSRDLGITVRGWGGELTILAALSPEGRVLDSRIWKHSETPEYLARLERCRWLEGLRGKSYGDAFHVGDDLDGVSRATVTVQALARSFRQTLRRLAVETLGLPPAVAEEKGLLSEPASGLSGRRPLLLHLLLLLTAALAVRGVARPRWPLSLAPLLLSVFLAWHWGLFLSFEPLLAWLRDPLTWPRQAWSSAVYLLLFILLGFWKGRAFCAGVCPLGASQDLLRFVARPFAVRLSIPVLLRGGKYLLLLLLVGGTVAGYDRVGRCSDPIFHLCTASWAPPLAGWLLGGILLVSAFLPRFWCHVLCPLGAFWGGIAAFGPGSSRQGAGRCAACGEGGALRSECLSCSLDRGGRTSASGPWVHRTSLLLFALLLAAFLAPVFWFGRRDSSSGSELEERARVFRQMLREKGLVLHDARYWKVLPRSRGERP